MSSAILSGIMNVFFAMLESRDMKNNAARGEFFAGLRMRSGLQRGVSRFDTRTGTWRIERGRMRLEEMDIRDVELVPDTRRVASFAERLNPRGVETAIHVVRTPKAEMDWFVPLSIETKAVHALRGRTPEETESEADTDPSGPPPERSS